jgi:HK97 family phage prohead protease
MKLKYKKMETLKDKPLEFKSFLEPVKEFDEKGIVTLYAAVFNSPDRLKDVILPNAFEKTISELGGEINHYINHDQNQVPGVIQELKADDYGLKVTSKLLIETERGKWTYEFYKASAEAGRLVRHSIGYLPVITPPISALTVSDMDLILTARSKAFFLSGMIWISSLPRR